jgi:hypothetical protein
LVVFVIPEDILTLIPAVHDLIRGHLGGSFKAGPELHLGEWDGLCRDGKCRDSVSLYRAAQRRIDAMPSDGNLWA